MCLLILPCVAPESCRFEASQRRRDTYPILIIFSITTLVPGLILGTMLLLRGSIVPLGTGVYIAADLKNPVEILNTTGTEYPFSISSDGEWIICNEVEPANLTIICVDSNGNDDESDNKRVPRRIFMIKNFSNETLCSYWDELAEGGPTQWSGKGCKFAQERDGMILCQCNHLTDFSAGTGETYETLNKIFRTALYIKCLQYIGMFLRLSCPFLVFLLLWHAMGTITIAEYLDARV